MKICSWILRNRYLGRKLLHTISLLIKEPSLISQTQAWWSTFWPILKGGAGGHSLGPLRFWIEKMDYCLLRYLRAFLPSKQASLTWMMIHHWLRVFTFRTSSSRSWMRWSDQGANGFTVPFSIKAQWPPSRAAIAPTTSTTTTAI